MVDILAVVHCGHPPAHARSRTACRLAVTHGTAHTLQTSAMQQSVQCNMCAEQHFAADGPCVVLGAHYARLRHVSAACHLWSSPGLDFRSTRGGGPHLLTIRNTLSFHAAFVVQAAAQPASSGGSRADKRSRCCGGCRNTNVGRDEPFRSRAWYPFSFGPIPHWEPICKVALPLVGVFIELYVGFRGWR